MTAEIIQFRPRPNQNRSDAELQGMLRRFWERAFEGPLLCEDYCGRTPCECYRDSISFAKSGEPKVPA